MTDLPSASLSFKVATQVKSAHITCKMVESNVPSVSSQFLPAVLQLLSVRQTTMAHEPSTVDHSEATRAPVSFPPAI